MKCLYPFIAVFIFISGLFADNAHNHVVGDFALEYSTYDQTYTSYLDNKLSPYSGSSLLLPLDSILLGFKHKDDKSKSIPIRLLEAIGADIINLHLIGIQHEVFGHGYRIRDIGKSYAKVVGYDLRLADPFPKKFLTRFTKEGYSYNSYMEMAVSIAGYEATAILADAMRLHWMSNDQAINGLLSSLYVGSKIDMIHNTDTINDGYIYGTDSSLYVNAYNATFPSNMITKKRIRAVSLINILDPFLFYSIYSKIHYILFSKAFIFPTFQASNTIKYLPSMRGSLTPFGPEIWLENYLVYNDKPAYFYVKGGSQKKLSYGGLGFLIPRIFNLTPELSLGLRSDFWIQPPLILSPGDYIFRSGNLFFFSAVYDVKEQFTKRAGLSTYIIADWKDHSGLGWHVELGYKTHGFLPGESLQSKINIRYGLSYTY